MDCDSSYFERIGSAQINRVVIGKLKLDVDLLAAIQELAKREGIQTGVILSGVGALRKAVFRNAKVIPPDYKMDDRYRIYLELEQPLELVSLTGWIGTKENKEIEVHCHFSASTVIDEKVVTLGGHLTPGTMTSIKGMIMIGVIEDNHIKAALDSRINQVDLLP
jgi:uncharacterized protein